MVSCVSRAFRTSRIFAAWRPRRNANIPQRLPGARRGELGRGSPSARTLPYCCCSAPLCDLLRTSAPRRDGREICLAKPSGIATRPINGSGRAEARTFRDEYLPGFAGCATAFPRRSGASLRRGPPRRYIGTLDQSSAICRNHAFNHAEWHRAKTVCASYRVSDCPATLWRGCGSKVTGQC